MERPKFNVDSERIKKVFDDITSQVNLFIQTPIFHKNFLKSQPSSTKSADTKSKTSYFAAENKKMESRGDRKRTNSSVAGVRTLRR